jgi:photosystem II stability/assembly factor-like uncharacterized protein
MKLFMKHLSRGFAFIFMVTFAMTAAPLHAQWNEIHQFGKPLSGLWFISKDIGYVCGGYDSAFLARTTDGGFIWEDITPPVDGSVKSVTFLDASTGFITWISGASGSHIGKTTDGGLTWTEKYSTPPRINTIVFPTPQVGYVFPVALEHANAIQSTNGGETWVEKGFFSGLAALVSIPDACFVEANLGYVVTGEGGVYKTATGGTNWAMSYRNGSYALNGIQFTDANTGWAAGELQDCYYTNPCGLVIKTTNAGLSWDETILPEPCNDVWFAKPDTGYIASHPILKTTDGGVNWYPDSVNVDAYATRLFFPTPEIGYAITGSTLLKMDPDVGVWTAEKQRPASFRVFPVPAKDQVTLSFFLPEESRLTIDLLSEYGDISRTLFSGNYSAGNHSVKADISGIPAGVYICRFTTGSDITTRKIIILN